MNEYLTGWAEYYRHGNSKLTFGKLDHWLWWTIARKMRRRHRGEQASLWTVCNRYLKPYRVDAQHPHYRRRKARNFGEWTDGSRKAAFIVDQLAFYPIQYVNRHSQANPYAEEGRRSLEENRKLTKLLGQWRRLQEDAESPPSTDLSHQIAAVLRIQRGHCPKCEKRLNKGDLKQLLHELVLPMSPETLRRLPILCKACIRK